MKMKKEDREIFLKQIFWEVVGSAFIAGGIYNFAVQAGFPMTGFSGISIILYQLFGVPVGFSTILLNIPVAILCYRLLGRHFFFSSLRCMLISSLMIDMLRRCSRFTRETVCLRHSVPVCLPDWDMR